MEHKRISVAYGDGIGPEIMESVIKILKEAKARISFETIEVGEKMFEKGYSSGISEAAWDTINQNKILLKAPITTPQGGGYKSLNVTMRKTLGLYSNVRPCKSYAPFVTSSHPELDIVIVRENEEDLYAGIEYRQTHDACHSIKLITRNGCEKIIRYAFNYAIANNRKKITCMSKDNIMKITDGLFHQVFKEISLEYPEIETNHYIVDIGAARLATKPEIFDVIVTENLYGDILSDIVAEISGSVGLAGSANIGTEHAMFEAIHGSAPDIAGKNIANPSGLLQAAIMMLVHIGQNDIASKIQNAWLATIEQGSHTADIYNINNSQIKTSTTEFTAAVIANLGKNPTKFKICNYSDHIIKHDNKSSVKNKIVQKDLVGIDISIDLNSNSQIDLAEKINNITANSSLGLKIITHKGLKVWPKEQGQAEYNGDLWTLRFVSRSTNKHVDYKDIIILMQNIITADFDIVKTENLYIFDDKLGFSLAQGE
jgi:isocitrate dehydrogenase